MSEDTKKFETLSYKPKCECATCKEDKKKQSFLDKHYPENPVKPLPSNTSNLPTGDSLMRLGFNSHVST